MNAKVLDGSIGVINGPISVVANSSLAAITVGKDIYTFVVNAMDAMEVVGKLSGAEKKAWVIAKAKEFISDPSTMTSWIAKISKFIDDIKSVYNTLKYLF